MSMNRKQKVGHVIVVAIIILLGVLFFIQRYSASSSKQFSIQSDVDFYLLGYHSVEGYNFKDNSFEKVSDEKIEIVKGQINQVVKRAEISNRYLLFSEEGPPLGVVGRIISVDFETGKIHYNKTTDYAFSTAGVNPDYYFTSEANTYDSFIAVFDTNLKEVDKYIFKNSVFATDFSNDGDNIYFLGVDVNSNDNYPTYLHHFSLKNKKLQFENKEILYDDPNLTYFFDDSIVKGKQLYSVSGGYRINSTKEKVLWGKVFHYDMESGLKEFFDLDEIGPVNIIELGENLLAIEHERNVSGKIAFSLFDVTSHKSSFVNLSRFGFSAETDYIKDIKLLDDNILLVLAGNKLIAYDINENTIILEKIVDEDMFHIWLK